MYVLQTFRLQPCTVHTESRSGVLACLHEALTVDVYRSITRTYVRLQAFRRSVDEALALLGCYTA